MKDKLQIVMRSVSLDADTSLLSNRHHYFIYDRERNVWYGNEGRYKMEVYELDELMLPAKPEIFCDCGYEDTDNGVCDRCGLKKKII